MDDLALHVQQQAAGRNLTAYGHQMQTNTPLLTFQGGRDARGVAHISRPLADQPTLLRGTHGNAGHIPADIAKGLEGRTFNSFRDFREAFWKEVASSKYAEEFNLSQLGNMSKGLAPDVEIGQTLGVKRVSYELHHKVPIGEGGATYDLSNIMVTTPKYHVEIYHKKRG